MDSYLSLFMLALQESIICSILVLMSSTYLFPLNLLRPSAQLQPPSPPLFAPLQHHCLAVESNPADKERFCQVLTQHGLTFWTAKINSPGIPGSLEQPSVNRSGIGWPFSLSFLSHTIYLLPFTVTSVWGTVAMYSTSFS